MQSAEPAQLLRNFARDESDAAFTEIVRRFVDFVYSTALRRVNYDRGSAEDVTQLVFIDLAKKAKSLPEDIMLGGWLHRHTCFRAATIARGDHRRRIREKLASEMNAIDSAPSHAQPELERLIDDAMEDLPGREHAALIMRYYASLPQDRQQQLLAQLPQVNQN